MTLTKIYGVLFGVALFLTGPSLAFAAIAFDNALTQQAQAGPGTTLTYSYTTSGSNRFLVVNAGCNTADCVTGVTYATIAMTLAGKQVNSAGNYQYMYYLFNPASGANNVVVTASSNPSAITGTTASYTGAAASGTVDFNSLTENVASGDHSIAVTVTTANSWLVARNFPTVADAVSVVNGVSRASFIQWADSNAAVGSGSQSIGWHWNAADNHSMTVIAFPPLAATPAAVSDGGVVTLFGDW